LLFNAVARLSGGGRPAAPQAQAGPTDLHPAITGAGGLGGPDLADHALPGRLLVQLSDVLGGDLASHGWVQVHLVLHGAVP